MGRLFLNDDHKENVMISRELVKPFFFMMSLGMASFAFSDQIGKRDAKALVWKSDVIALGTFETVEAKMFEGKIFTEVVFDVGQTLKGEEQREITLIYDGGTLENVGVTSGASNFSLPRLGESAFIFAVENDMQEETYRLIDPRAGSIYINDDQLMGSNPFVSNGVSAKKLIKKIKSIHTKNNSGLDSEGAER